MSGYARWCIVMGRVFGVMFLLIFGAACVLHSWVPLNALWGPLGSAALVHGIGGPIVLRHDSPDE